MILRAIEAINCPRAKPSAQVERRNPRSLTGAISELYTTSDVHAKPKANPTKGFEAIQTCQFFANISMIVACVQDGNQQSIRNADRIDAKSFILKRNIEESLDQGMFVLTIIKETVIAHRLNLRPNRSAVLQSSTISS